MNHGVGGDDTPQLLWRIREGLLDGIQPKAVVLCIGVNNIWAGFDAGDTLKGIETVVAAVGGKCPGTKVLLIGNTHLTVDLVHRDRVRTINAGQAKLADGEHVEFIDFSEKMLKPDGSLLENLYAGDKLHLSPAGYGLWSREMDSVLSGMLK